jgi:ferredoxin
MFKKNDSTHVQCHGCSLCALVCPVCHQQQDVMRTPHGHAKTLQHNGEVESEALFSCILCGACIPVCPQDIDLMDMFITLRIKASKGEQHAETNKAVQQRIQNNLQQNKIQNISGKTVFLANETLRTNKKYLDNIFTLLNENNNLILADDDGADIALALETGIEIPAQRINQFFDPLKQAGKIIVADGLLMRELMNRLPQNRIVSLGHELSSLHAVKTRLCPTDFYIIESRAYHADYDTLLTHYNALQQEQGCMLNLDLHRLAIPTGANGVVQIDAEKQSRWILEGWDFERIVVEDINDIAILSRISDKPVVHVTEII